MAAAQLLDGEGAEMPNKETARGCRSLIAARAAEVGAPFEPAVGATDRLYRVRYGSVHCESQMGTNLFKRDC